MEQTRTGNGTGKLVAALLSLAAVFAGEMAGVIVAMIFDLDLDLFATMGGAIVAVVAFAALGGKDYLRFDGKAILESWKFMWWIVAISAVLMGWDLWDYLAAGETVHPGWFLRCLNALLLCLAIGANEEGMFRGLLFGGLLGRLGERKNGIWWAVIISSIAFGCAHVSLSDFDIENPLTFVQGFLKVVQTGIYAVMLCAVMLKTKNIIGAMMIHAIDDWLLFIVSIGLFGETLETEYVTADTDEAITTIIFYLIIIALYLPTFIKALREIKKIQAPQFGPFFSETLEPVPAAAGYLQQPYPEQAFGQAPYAQQPFVRQPYVQQQVPVQQPYVQQQVPTQQPYVQQQAPTQQPFVQQPYAQGQGQPYAQPAEPQPQQVVYYPVPTPAEPLMPTSTMGYDQTSYGQVPQPTQQQGVSGQPYAGPTQVLQQAQYAPQMQVPQQAQYAPQPQVPQPSPEGYVQKSYPQNMSAGRPPRPEGL